VVATARCQEPAVVGEVDGRNGALVPGHEADAVPGDTVPQTKTPVARTWNCKVKISSGLLTTH
jgi:hypothetical protein